MSLITSLEQAGEGSRGLDARIEKAVGLAVALDGAGRATDAVGTRYRVPHYTTSLDCALALAERLGWPFWSGGKGTENAWAHLYDRHPDQDGPTHNAKAATPALALCIAILKAKTND